ncbi:hypothetical protein H257_00891 [Aphanomyces astaci]|uniref:Uncharacterized protein n=1 Tax=Aphanomyces astaci TaxID=112090 RepID=W4HDP6_APHAT|nr:hypothetical protein H257_00891 [Aphanomyces astaci]ETV89711.1 hypothetical protein H257_00891 [Aphanomyces astaci]|eukprot:XP_009822111.1 hypothetical protein H257_00891 [Aphanomyces astaci]
MHDYSRSIATVRASTSKRPLTLDDLDLLTRRSMALTDRGIIHVLSLLIWKLTSQCFSREGESLSVELLDTNSLEVKQCSHGSPIEPNMCVVLAMGMYLAMRPFQTPYGALFLADKPIDNFAGAFANLVNGMFALDGTPHNLGTKSMEMGAIETSVVTDAVRVMFPTLSTACEDDDPHGDDLDGVRDIHDKTSCTDANDQSPLCAATNTTTINGHQLCDQGGQVHKLPMDFECPNGRLDTGRAL